VGDATIDLDSELDEPAVKVVGSPLTRRRWRKRITLLVVVGCSFGLLAFGRAVRDAREAARRAQCLCNYCQILLALHTYHEQFNVFPPAYVTDANGTPVHSWRVLILPFMEHSTLYNQYDFSEPWDGPNNIKLLDRMPNTFACPSRFSSTTNLTSYVAVVGPGTLFPGSGSVKLADIADGTANTLAVVEVDKVKVPWTAPSDLDVRTMSFRINDPKKPAIGSKHPGGANVGVADASQRFASDSISPANLRALITIAGGEGVTLDQVMPK
jgi:hypothetical protein